MSVCENCGKKLDSNDCVVFTPSGKAGTSITVCQQCAPAMEAKLLPKIGLLNILGGLLFGLIFTAAASVLWYLASFYLGYHFIFAVVMGAFVGLGVYLGSGKKKSRILVVISAVLAGIAVGFGMYLTVRHIIMANTHMERARLFIPPAAMIRMIVKLIRVEPMFAFDLLAAIVIGGAVLYPSKYSVRGKTDSLLSSPQSSASDVAQPELAEDESEEKSHFVWLIERPSIEKGTSASVASQDMNYGQVARPKSGNFFYRMLGYVAKVSADMRRFSVNGIPSNYVVICTLGFAVSFGCDRALNELSKQSVGYSIYLAAVLAVLGALLFLLMVAVIIRKYTVFRPMLSCEMGMSSISSSVDGDKMDLRFTGKLRLSSIAARRFLDVSAMMGELDTGEQVFFSNIEASSTMYGVRTNDLCGIWMLTFKPETLHLDSEGFLYLGKEIRPALSLSFTEIDTDKRASAILSFGNENERSRFCEKLRLR